MLKLNKAELDERDTIVQRLNTHKDNVEAAIIAFNEAVETAFNEVESAVNAYNEAIGAANSLKSTLAESARGYFEEKSEKWQEGENGEKYASWIEALEEEIEPLEIEAPTEIPEAEFDAIDTFESLPTNPDEV
jgi:hypothetical protein